MAKKTTSKVKSIHPHIRITDPDEIKLLDRLKESTREKTYSGALMAAAKQHFELQKKLKESELTNEVIIKRLSAAEEVVTANQRSNTLTESYMKSFGKSMPRHPQGTFF